MSVKTETRRAGDFVLSEANGTLSRENIVIDVGVLVPGTVLGKITATGKYVALAPAAEDGSEDAAAVLYDHADATASDAKAVGMVRLAELRADLLVWPSGITTEQKTAALLALAGSHIVAR
ncbi:Bacteriophage lambda head decoration protein D [compost metagenome]